MLPSLRFLHIVGSKGVDPHCCDYAANTVVFSDEGVPKGFNCQGPISEPRLALNDEHFHCSAMVLSSDGSVALVGGTDGKLIWITLGKPDQSFDIELPLEESDIANSAIMCIEKDADDTYAVGLSRLVTSINL